MWLRCNPRVESGAEAQWGAEDPREPKPLSREGAIAVHGLPSAVAVGNHMPAATTLRAPPRRCCRNEGGLRATSALPLRTLCS